jgi:uncharacterized protein (DUF1330 family)
MPAYAIALLSDVDFNAEVIDYVRHIEATMTPFDGRFLVHGATADVVEGTMTSDCVIIGFPSMAHARGWYTSEAYTQLAPLRARNSKGPVFLVDGVPEGYSAVSLLDKMAVPA